MKKKYCLLITFISVVQFLCAQKIKENKEYKQKKEPTTFLGVDVDNVGTRTNGLYVNAVIRGYGAEKAGLKIADTLKTINGDTVHTFFELAYLLQKYQPQQQV
ncbi:MAG: PDZ domain-containing protein, partial [Chitinophagaceae bacterium]